MPQGARPSARGFLQDREHPRVRGPIDRRGDTKSAPVPQILARTGLPSSPVQPLSLGTEGKAIRMMISKLGFFIHPRTMPAAVDMKVKVGDGLNV